MSTSVTIRIRQQGYVRASGYQATQWAVTIPTSDPITDPPIATSPLNHAPLFVIRTVAGIEFLDRVATLQDQATLPVSELRYWDVRGGMGYELYTSAVAGDVLTVTTPLDYWIDGLAPYQDQNFTVASVDLRASWPGATISAGSNQVLIPGFTYTNDDAGRWVHLVLDDSSSYWGQIVRGSGALIYLQTALSVSATVTALFHWVRVDAGAVEPRYFPTRERHLTWELWRSGSRLIAGGTGGCSMRDQEAPQVLSVRNTTVALSETDGNNLFLVSRQAVAALQQMASIVASDFGTLSTYTVGP